MGQLSLDRLKAFEDLSWRYFDWITVLNNAGITDIQDLSGQYLLKCPFHEDKRPSFRIRVHEKNYHCFSCNAFGTVADLAWRLSGKQLKKSLFYDQALKRLPGMQAELGFTSLYIDKGSLDPAFNGRRVFNPNSHIGSSLPTSVLARKVRKLDDSWDTLVFTMSLLQSGDLPENVLARVKNMKTSTAVKVKPEHVVSLMELLDSEGD